LAGKYRDGLDENGQWEAETGNLALEKNGAVVDLGQVPAWMKKQLDAMAEAGSLVRYRGHWNTLLPNMGMGPLKTIWAVPEIARTAGVR
jgi:hypothetical protein